MSQFREMHDPCPSDVCEAEVKYLKATQSTQVLQACIGDSGTAKFEPLKALHSFQSDESGIGNAGLGQVEFLEVRKSRQVSQPGVGYRRTGSGITDGLDARKPSNRFECRVGQRLPRNTTSTTL